MHRMWIVLVIPVLILWLRESAHGSPAAQLGVSILRAGNLDTRDIDRALADLPPGVGWTLGDQRWWVTVPIDQRDLDYRWLKQTEAAVTAETGILLARLM